MIDPLHMSDPYIHITKTIHPDGSIRFYNEFNYLHNDNGPAIIFPEGLEEYWSYGRFQHYGYKGQIASEFWSKGAFPLMHIRGRYYAVTLEEKLLKALME